jgi:hypothetical protein
LRPDLAAQWCADRNGKLTPADVTLGSDRRVWWRCAKDRRHVWQTGVANRVRGTGCPFCVGQQRGPERSLAVRAPRVAALWDEKRNAPLTELEVQLHSHRRVFWRCPKGPDHRWAQSIGSRVRAKSPCPFCAGKRFSVTNSLAAKYPKVAAQWHPTRNGALRARDVTAYASTKVWWRCAFGHDFQGFIGNRTRHGTGCPVCPRRRGRQALTANRRTRVWLPSDFTG